MLSWSTLVPEARAQEHGPIREEQEASEAQEKCTCHGPPPSAFLKSHKSREQSHSMSY